MRKKKAPVSLATALAMSVLPVPGGPYNRMPRGGCKKNMRFITTDQVQCTYTGFIQNVKIEIP